MCYRIIVYTEACNAQEPHERHPSKAEVCWRQCATQALKSQGTGKWLERCGDLSTTNISLISNGCRLLPRNACAVCAHADLVYRMTQIDAATHSQNEQVNKLEREQQRRDSYAPRGRQRRYYDERVLETSRVVQGINQGLQDLWGEANAVELRESGLRRREVVQAASKESAQEGRADLYYFGSQRDDERSEELDANPEVSEPRHFPDIKKRRHPFFIVPFHGGPFLGSA